MPCFEVLQMLGNGWRAPSRAPFPDLQATRRLLVSSAEGGSDVRKFYVFILALALLVSAVYAGYIGFPDMIWPVSLPAEILGIVFFLIGLTGFFGFILLIFKRAPLALIAVGSLANSYTDMTIVLYSYRYQHFKQYIFALLALLCFALACITLPRVWGYISKALKAVGISLSLVVVGIGAWYHNFYIPENIQVGIHYGLTVQSVARSGRDTLVSLQLTMRNVSSVPVRSVGSMVAVSGVSYADGRRESSLSNAQAQKRLTDYAHNLSPNSNIRFSGNPKTTILTVLRPIHDGSFLFPNDTFADDFVVIVPERRIKAVHVEILLQYVRSTRIVFGTELKPKPETLNNCPKDEDERFFWDIDQSALRTFTNGPLIIYSDWCADLHNPFIGYGILGVQDRESPAEQKSLAARLGVFTSSRFETLLLH
jgi:hypothetical protein